MAKVAAASDTAGSALLDEDEIRRHLRAHGVEAGGLYDNYGAEGNGPSLYLEDPEGNVVELKGAPSGR